MQLTTSNDLLCTSVFWRKGTSEGSLTNPSPGAANCPANTALTAPFHGVLCTAKTACFFCNGIRGLQRPRLT